MSSRALFTFASAVLATVPHAAAEILSCADVECPIVSGTTAARCAVGNRTFNAVGAVGIDTDADGLRGLSWTKAVGAEFNDLDERTFDQSFYLGTPEGFDLGSTGACAVLFTQVSERVRFGDEDDSIRMSEGTCSDALSADCVEALLDRARGLEYEGLSSAEACERLQEEFSDNLDSACARFSLETSGWTGVRAKPLSGDQAPQPISDQQNATSDCWPVLPKSHDLTLVESVNNTGDLFLATLYKYLYSVTPVLTVFFPGNGSGDVVSQLEAQLTCLKPIDLSTASNETMDSGASSEGATGMPGRSAAVWTALASVVFASLLG